MIRTLVAEPLALVREGLAALFKRDRDIELIAAVQHATEILPAVRKARPQVALIAAAFLRDDGIHIARKLHAALPTCRCAILSHTRHVDSLQRAIAAHVDGYLLYDCPAEFLTEAVRQLAAGNKVIDPSLAFTMVERQECPLTLREAETLRVAAKGFSTAEIADSLGLTVGTVRNYLSRAITKIEARNRVDAIRIAEESGWL